MNDMKDDPEKSLYYFKKSKKKSNSYILSNNDNSLNYISKVKEKGGNNLFAKRLSSRAIFIPCVILFGGVLFALVTIWSEWSRVLPKLGPKESGSENTSNLPEDGNADNNGNTVVIKKPSVEVTTLTEQQDSQEILRDLKRKELILSVQVVLKTGSLFLQQREELKQSEKSLLLANQINSSITTIDLLKEGVYLTKIKQQEYKIKFIENIHDIYKLYAESPTSVRDVLFEARKDSVIRDRITHLKILDFTIRLLQDIESEENHDHFINVSVSKFL